MRASIAAAGLLCVITGASVRAEEIKDFDKWAADFTDATGRTDVERMQALIKTYYIPSPDFRGINDLLSKIQNLYSGSKTLHVEQFGIEQIGNFAKRFSIAVIYDTGQQFYRVSLLKGENGWRFYQIQTTNDLDKLLKPE